MDNGVWNTCNWYLDKQEKVILSRKTENTLKIFFREQVHLLYIIRNAVILTFTRLFFKVIRCFISLSLLYNITSSVFNIVILFVFVSFSLCSFDFETTLPSVFNVYLILLLRYFVKALPICSYFVFPIHIFLWCLAYRELDQFSFGKTLKNWIHSSKHLDHFGQETPHKNTSEMYYN